MANETDLTPADTGTEATPTPGAGTDAGQVTGGESAAPPEVDYKTKFSESTKEAQRLFQQNQQLTHS